MYATLTKVFNVIIEKDFDMKSLDKVIDGNNAEFKLLQRAIKSKDRNRIYIEFVNACVDIRGKIIKLAAISPENEDDEIIVRKTLPTFASSLVNFTTQIELIMSNITPLSNNQPDVDATIEAITKKYDKVDI
jgi:hypothetical protein